ncbi:MAG: fumarylacetoacetate hydrolase family protein [Gammaproteobacteria bacterium]|nr:fumarylacetoacetate hydrolase family protein [Gammaproteobacteria bacterium]
MDKLICAGKNYLEHAEEMKDGIPEKPVLFLKPPSVLKICSAWQSECELKWPTSAQAGDIHYECELVFLIKQDGYSFSAKEARAAISHVTVGLDLTNRMLQKKAKEMRAPWEVGKVFPDAAVIGPWLSLDNLEMEKLNFEFVLNGDVRQRGRSADMRFNPIELLVYASQYFPICAGDVLFTGTPVGVGPIHRGDVGQLSLQEYAYRVKWN